MSATVGEFMGTLTGDDVLCLALSCFLLNSKGNLIIQSTSCVWHQRQADEH